MPNNPDSMPKPERERTILRFLADREVILPPKVLFNNLKELEGVTFSYRTTKRLLKDLRDRSLVEQVDIGRGYYKITDDGRAYLAGDVDADEFEES